MRNLQSYSELTNLIALDVSVAREAVLADATERPGHAVVHEAVGVLPAGLIHVARVVAVAFGIARFLGRTIAV